MGSAGGHHGNEKEAGVVGHALEGASPRADRVTADVREIAPEYRSTVF
jgi:hypothetical protein